MEVMWLLERLYPDYKSIAEFRRMHREAVTAAGVELVRFAKVCGLIRGEWIAVDGSRFRAVASIDTARERFQLQRYLDNIEKLDREQTPEFDSAGVQAALERLKHHPEPEIGFMVMGRHTQPAYNLQSAVDAEHALFIAPDVVLDAADNRSLEPMADAAKAVLGKEDFCVVADTGYSNGEQASNCEAKGMFPCVPAKRTRNPHGVRHRGRRGSVRWCVIRINRHGYFRPSIAVTMDTRRMPDNKALADSVDLSLFSDDHR